jgi:hypothetical protein
MFEHRVRNIKQPLLFLTGYDYFVVALSLFTDLNIRRSDAPDYLYELQPLAIHLCDRFEFYSGRGV